MLDLVRLSACLMLVCPWASAQRLSFGLDGGAPLSDLSVAVPPRVTATHRYTFGPALVLGMRHGFGLEAGFLYKRMDLGVAAEPARAAVHRWELPLLVRYQFSGSPVRPFVHLGVSLNRILRVSGASVCARGGSGEEFLCMAGQTVTELRHRTTRGVVIGGGVERRFRAVSLGPELRLTYWQDRNFGVRNSALRSNLTQVELLVGVRF